MPIPNYMITMDEHGKQLGPAERLPEPERVAERGLAALPGYVARFFASTASFRSLGVFTTNRLSGFGLCHRMGEPVAELLLALDRRTPSPGELALREFFAARGIAPSRDYLAGNGGEAEAVRVLQFTLPASPEATAQLCSELLRACFGVEEADALDFSFEGHA